jgi:hypothetical protein
MQILGSATAVAIEPPKRPRFVLAILAMSCQHSVPLYGGRLGRARVSRSRAPFEPIAGSAC